MNLPYFFRRQAILLLVFILAPPLAQAGDWPMWGHDGGRGNNVETELSQASTLLWSRQFSAPERAWPVQFEDYHTSGNPLGIGKLSFDVSYEPVVGGGRLYMPSMVADRVTAYATETGEELWRFYADGPVRFAPVYWQDKLYFAADDGYLYCLEAESGRKLWRIRGSFASRTVLGNQRLISIWPARGGPVISDETLYFAAGILPFEGIFIHAVCPQTGELQWSNSISGAIWDLHQHGGAWAYGGPSPQGYLAVSGDYLIVPGGRTPPAVYNRHTGEFLYYRQATGAVGKGAGGYRLHSYGNWFFNHGMLYSLKDGAQYGPVPGEVLTDDSFIGVSDGIIIAHSSQIQEQQREVRDRLGRGAIRVQYELKRQWSQAGIENLQQVHFKAGSHLGISRAGGMAALLELQPDGQPGEIVWEQAVDGEIWRMIAASRKIFVVTESGRLYCFGETENPAPVQHQRAITEVPVTSEISRLIDSIVETAEIDCGYSLVFGGSPEIPLALARSTRLKVTAVYSDKATVDRLRQQLDDAGLHGRRVAVLQAGGEDLNLPPYLADLVISGETEWNQQQLEQRFNLLRPYGGRLYTLNAGDNFKETFKRADLAKAELESQAGLTVITRSGGLPGAGQWTHQYGNPGNRTFSADQLVKAPLGTLWFGGPSNRNILPRHYSGPIPQVSGGRLFILGVDSISARCVYTGRQLWERELPGVGHMFTNLELEQRFEDGQEVYMSNHPGANLIGSPYVSVEDGVYLIFQDNLLRLDPATGATLTEFRLPELAQLRRNEWGHLLVSDDILVATVEPQYFEEDADPLEEETWWNATSSSLLLGMNRHSGEILWARRAERVGFRHNAIAAGNGRLYAIDGLSEGVVSLLQRRGLEAEMEPVLLAIDIATGEVLWQSDEQIFGTWLGYYEDRDILLEGGRHGGKRNVADEPRRHLVARTGATGEPAWHSDIRYSGALGLHSEMIIPGKPGETTLIPDTGEPLLTGHPLTGEPEEWRYHRYYGCGTMNTSTHLIMFRSGAAGFTDLHNQGGTGNLGGFRSGCTNNLVAADGVLNAPDYTRTCTCSYQLQTSFGFIHQPEVEMWTLNRMAAPTDRIRNLGINFGAPGNRRQDNVLWLEYPKVYGAGPELPAKITASSEGLFRNHASWTENPEIGHGWVAAYGLRGVETISIDLMQETAEEPVVYDLTLYFAEPDGLTAGQRVFTVLVQQEPLLIDYDIAREAGGSRRLVKARLPGIMVEDQMEIKFEPGTITNGPVVSGIEIRESRD